MNSVHTGGRFKPSNTAAATPTKYAASRLAHSVPSGMLASSLFRLRLKPERSNAPIMTPTLTAIIE
jgi:hypothetical protein